MITCTNSLQKLRINFPESQLLLTEDQIMAVALLSCDSRCYMDPVLMAAGVDDTKCGFVRKPVNTSKLEQFCSDPMSPVNPVVIRASR